MSRVLCFSPNNAVWRWTFPQAQFLEALKKRGDEVVYVYCDREFSDFCMSMASSGVGFEADPARKAAICALCVRSAGEVCEAFGFTSRPLGDFLTQAERVETGNISANEPLESLIVFKVDNVPVGRFALYETVIQTKAVDPHLSPEGESLFRAVFRSTLVTALATRRMMAEIKPDVGITYHSAYAYNRAFGAACRTTPSPDYVAVLDDDEFPDPNWLTEMIRVALEYRADIIGGPVLPVFYRPDHWLAQSGFYAPVRRDTGPVPIIYGAGNMLIQRSVLEQYLDEPFLHAFAFTGGSDYDFFWRCRIDGRSFAWADKAEVFETTPPARTTIGYLLRRKFRNGSEATRLERKFLGRLAGAVRGWYIGIGLLGLGLLSLPVAALRGRRAMMSSLMRTARGAGRIAAEFDLHYEQYR